MPLPRSPLRRRLLAALALLATPLLPAAARAQGAAAPPAKWYDRLSLRGYAQVRYNRLLETNPDLQCAQCDRSIGGDGGFFLRRARLVLSGEVHPRVAVYIQPDFASEISGTLHMAQVRDYYADVFLDDARTWRVRLGQSKVPWGWENLQSSSNRLPLDRNDALNSALPNERDFGLMVYWASETARRRFRILTDSGLKGSNDYGVLGLGLTNGQTANRSEANDGPHVTLRASYPFRLANGQFVEVGVQGYRGRFVVPTRSDDVAGAEPFDDARVAGTLVVYPQPLGLQAEWNAGTGPEFDPATRAIVQRRLEGGYVQAMLRTTVRGRPIIPFVRAQRYDGGKKFELDARAHRVRELEVGAEWLVLDALELTAMYVISERRTRDGEDPDDDQRGRLLRLQAQGNY